MHPKSLSVPRVAMAALLFTTSLVLLLATAAARSADAHDRFYSRIDLGASFVQDTMVKSTSPYIQSGKVRFDPGVRLDAGIGYQFKNGLAVEIESGILANPTDSIRDEFSAGGDVTFIQVPILANFVYNMPTRSRFRPYVGAGIGGVASGLEDYDLYYGRSDSDIGLAWQGFAGCRYQISSSFELGITYKYLGTSEQSFDAFGLRMEGTHTHSVTVSLSRKF